MTILQYGVENIHIIRCRHQSSWKCPDFVKAPDMADFGPDVIFSDRQAHESLPVNRPKPVCYLPVPRRNGEEQIPKELYIKIMLFEPGVKRAVEIPSRENIDVDIEILNIWPQKESKDTNKVKKPRLVRLTGKLCKSVCEVPISKEMLADWLKPSKELKAQINENLIDFRFRIPSIVFNGSAFAGESQNRIFLYRRKNMVFIPGVFGSQFQITTLDNHKIGFPDLFDDDLPIPKNKQEAKVIGAFAALGLKYQKITGLECDAGGTPLVKPKDPKILMITIPVIGPRVYDSFDKLKKAKNNHFPILPKDFRLYTLHVAPYDWRGDLNETSIQMLARLKKIQEGPYGRRAKDSDDQIAVIGHSTGGLVIRGMMKEKNASADQVISHAFFMNVPFRGAPKTMSVIPTGRDPFTGQSMIPFVDPKSLKAIALSAPIVYHLSPSKDYPSGILRPIKKKNDYEENSRPPEELKQWIELAISSGFMPSRKIIRKDAKLSEEQKRELASNAQVWTQYWQDRFDRLRGRTLIEWINPEKRNQTWEKNEITHRQLGAQNDLRVEQGFSDELSQKAQAFHDACEKMARDGEWQDKSYIFYSVAEELTTLAVKAERLEAKVYTDKKEFMRDLDINENDLKREAIYPPQSEGKAQLQPKEIHPQDEKKELRYGFVEEGVTIHESWSQIDNTLLREKWRFSTLRQRAGDGTVPLCSLLGFGGPAKVFKKLLETPKKHIEKSKAEKELNNQTHDNTSSNTYDAKKAEQCLHEKNDYVFGPNHVNAPNDSWAWARIVEVLQGCCIDEHLATIEIPKEKEIQSPNTVNPRDGIDTDTDLLFVQEVFYRERNKECK